MRWVSKAWRVRENRPFIARTTGCISLITGCGSSGSKLVAARFSSSRDRSLSGRSERRTTHATASSSSGAMTAIGQMERSAKPSASACRVAVLWPT